MPLDRSGFGAIGLYSQVKLRSSPLHDWLEIRVSGQHASALPNFRK